MSRSIFLFLSLVLLTAGDLYAQDWLPAGGSHLPHSASLSFQTSNGIEFIPNRGQLADQFGKPMPEVLFTLDANGMKSYFTKSSMHYVFSKYGRGKDTTDVSPNRSGGPHHRSIKGDTLCLYRVDVHFIGANPNAEIFASDTADHYTNYYLPQCPDGITHVQAFGKIVYRDLYPNIDLVLYRTDGSNPAEEISASPIPNNPINPINPGSGLEYDFIVHPGGDVRAIRIGYDHATSLAVGEDGSLKLMSPFGEVVESKPVGYQIGEDVQEGVQCDFRLQDNQLSFEMGNYDYARDLYIDPVRLWGTYFGGSDSSNYTTLNDLAVDRSGNVNVGGQTNGHNNIATSGAFQVTYGGDTHQFIVASDAYVASFGPSGNLRWATYYGGDSDESVNGVACDNSGEVVIVGYTGSKNIPMSSGAFQPTFGGNKDAFLAVFDSLGTRRWGTYITEGANTQATGVAVDSAQNIVVAGWVAGGSTHTPDIVTPGAYNSNYGSGGGFVVKFTSGGSRSWGTLLGVPSIGSVLRVGVDATNAVYVGTTWGSPSATTELWKFSSTGSFSWTTDLGTHNPTELHDIAVGRSGNTYVVSQASYTGYATPGAYQIALAGNTDGLLAKYDSAGHKVWVTYYGGTDKDALNRVALDTGENIYAAGTTLSSSGIATPGEFQTTLPLDGFSCPFLIKFDNGGHRIFGTYYERWGEGWGVGINRQSDIFLGGTTGDRSGGYATSGAFEASPLGSSLFIAKFCNPVQLHITSTSSSPICQAVPDTLKTRTGYASYQWNLNGTPISTGATPSYPFVTPQVAGTYNYTVNAVGTDLCATVSDTFSLVVRPVAQISFPPLNTVCPGSSIKLMASVSGSGPFIYSWSPKATLDHPDSAQPIATPTNPTSYALTVTDINGCATTNQVSVSWYLAPKVTIAGKTSGGTIPACAGSPLALATATTSGTAPFIYSWLPSTGLDRTDSSAVFATPKSNTMYWVVVTDQHGCVGRDSILVVVSPSPKVSAGPQLSICPGSSLKISATETGTLPYTVQWSPTTGLSDPAVLQPSASPTATTLYTVTVTNSVGCSAHDTVRVRVTDSLEPTVTATGPLTVCAGDSLQLSAPAGYSSYQWSSGERTEAVKVTKTGDYSVHVTSTGGCQGSSHSVHVTVSTDSIPVPVLSEGRTSVCAGDSVEIGLVGIYRSYRWSSGDTTAKIVVKKSGDYFVTVTNAGGCAGTSTAMAVTVNPSPQVDLNTTGPVTFCAGDSLLLSATPGYHYAWWNGTTKLTDTTAAIYVKAGGAYSVTATNDAGCDATTAPLAVTVTTSPHPVIAGPTSICINGKASYSIAATAGTIAWQINPASLGTITSGLGTNQINVQWGGTATGTLQADITLDGCSGTAQLPITIDAHLSPTVLSSGPGAFCEGGSDTLDAGAGYVSYQWSNNGGQISGETKQKFVVTQSGTYTVFVTNASGCDGTSQSYAVTVFPTPAKPVITESSGQLSSTSATQYQWSLSGVPIAGATAQTLQPAVAGTYSVTIQDGNGCTATSDPVTFASGAGSALVSVPSKSFGMAGIPLTVPLMLVSSANLPQSGATSFVANIRFAASLLSPQAPTPTGVVVGADRIITVTGSVTQPSGILASMRFLALASTDSCSELTIDTFYFPNASLPVTTRNGEYCRIGECGAPFLSTTGKAFWIKSVRPNPSLGEFRIDYELTEEGETQLAMEDVLGRTAKLLKRDWMKPGEYSDTYRSDDLPSGAYRLVLRSPSKTVFRMVQVMR